MQEPKRCYLCNNVSSQEIADEFLGNLYRGNYIDDGLGYVCGECDDATEEYFNDFDLEDDFFFDRWDED